MDYRFDALDFADDSEAAREQRRGWLQALRRGFNHEQPDDEFEGMWLEHVTTDDVVCRGVWLPEGAYGAGPVPVATTAWFDKTLNVGRELLPLRMITDVTTSPAHRRRGLVRRLMEGCLSDAVTHDLPLVALTASEATIYGRFGFGVATFGQEIELDTGPRFGLRDFTDPGRVEQVDPAGTWPVTRDLLDRFHHTSRGSVGTPQFYEPLFTGRWNFFASGPDKKLRAAVHLTAEETVDGVVVWRPEGRDGDKRKAKVLLHLADDAAAGLALWDFVGSIDLVNHVEYGDFPPADPLPWALRDFNAVRYTGRYEFLWVRVLDVPRTLMARPWTADGEVVLAVEDPQGHATGSYAISTCGGAATVARTDTDPDVTIDAETLGSLSLGGVSVGTLRASGRVIGDPGAVERLAAMADLPDEPYNILGF
ncbi:GNAT family N-acetyltransferase [Nocardioides sp. GXQ0305]|uniref:GNAT family N-acetyltransferase n=1 Tax=Nocardioides sp. GXQ0305 TaxID=3423912 RepID=UPI003D7E329C